MLYTKVAKRTYFSGFALHFLIVTDVDEFLLFTKVTIQSPQKCQINGRVDIKQTTINNTQSDLNFQKLARAIEKSPTAFACGRRLRHCI